jgi:hypothetical protein
MTTMTMVAVPIAEKATMKGWPSSPPMPWSSPIAAPTSSSGSSSMIFTATWWRSKWTTMTDRDADRLALLDRIALRVPELDLDQQRVEWTSLEDGHEALLVNGGGIDGGAGAFFVNHGNDLHAVGSLAPLIDGAIGCIVIRPDGSRVLARAVCDPLA